MIEAEIPTLAFVSPLLVGALAGYFAPFGISGRVGTGIAVAALIYGVALAALVWWAKHV